MATYPVVNTKTGETKEVKMSVHEWDQWREDNPDWSRDYSDPSTMPGVWVRLVSGGISLSQKILDGILSWRMHQKSEVLK